MKIPISTIKFVLPLVFLIVSTATPVFASKKDDTMVIAFTREILNADNQT